MIKCCARNVLLNRPLIAGFLRNRERARRKNAAECRAGKILSRVFISARKRARESSRHNTQTGSRNELPRRNINQVFDSRQRLII